MLEIILYMYVLYLGFGYYAGVKPAWKRMLIGHKILNAPALVCFGVMDVLFNATVGSLLFWEYPFLRETDYYQQTATLFQRLFAGRVWTFSQRLNEHVFDFGWRGVVAKAFARLLNTIYPGHIEGRK